MTPVDIILRCTACGYQESYTRPLDACPDCGGSYFDADYILDGPLNWPYDLRNRPPSMWRYRELLPIRDEANIVTMGEGFTPLLRSENLSAMLGLKHLYIKDERQGPTGSFKDRQASLAISTLREWGVGEMVVASTGNVAIAYSAYAARANIDLIAFTISSVPSEKMREVMIYGSELVKVTGTYDQAKQVAARYAESKNLFLDKGVKTLAARESMKTLAYEIAEQLGEMLGPDQEGRPWRSPDWYIQSVSGGMGPVGVIKGFQDLEAHGLSIGMPKLAAVQSSGCDPMVRAWRAGDREAAPILHPRTRIATVATGTPGLSYSLLYDYVKAHGGLFESVSDEEAYRSLKQVAQLEGLSVEPATALAFAGLVKMVRAGVIDSDEVVVLNLTGHTFPVEKHLLGEDFIRDVDLSTASEEIPREGLLVALEEIDVGMARVLVIEDDPGASQLVRRILEAYGVPEVLQAYDGGQGIDMIESTMPDLIVLDLMMPGVDGFGVLDYLKSRDDLRDIPVIIVTAKDLTPGERKRLRGQATGLLAKGSLMDGDLLQGLIDEQLG